jgi:2-polyprenyl-3-methyl-5-hydroxy-6-metoxy-1,4-benzoquinol methylase
MGGASRLLLDKHGLERVGKMSRTAPEARMATEASKFNRIQIPCPVCDSGRYEVLYEPWVAVDDPHRLYGAASGLQGTQHIVRCADCGMVYENPRYPSDEIVKAYQQADNAGHDSQHAMRVESFRRTLVRLKGRIPAAGARVLDVGTGGGAFLEAGNQFGYDTYGMEPSAYLVQKGRERHLKIEQGTIERHDFAPQSFDMVCLWDVLEHLPEPKEALIRIRKLLKPGGILLINYPDIGTLPARLTGKRFWWIISVHLQHFTRKSVADICRRTGFEAFHFRRYWQILEFGYLEKMAVHYNIPGAALIARLTPGFIARMPIPYYASQTTALARLAS